MEYLIGYSGEYSDELVVEGDTIDEIRELAFQECDRRGWERSKCWSKELKE